jgi:hypothetical protein
MVGHLERGLNSGSPCPFLKEAARSFALSPDTPHSPMMTEDYFLEWAINENREMPPEWRQNYEESRGTSENLKDTEDC